MAFDGIQPALPSLQPAEGLTSVEARQQLAIHGPNLIRQRRPGILTSIFYSLWGPVPWLLEISLVFELLFHKPVEAALVGVFLLLNSAIETFQEERSWKAIELLRNRLAPKVLVLRDHAWQTIPAQELVPGDFIHLTQGDIFPADVEICRGQVSIEVSSSPGMYFSRNLKIGEMVDSGAIVKEGEADATVTATGKHTRYGENYTAHHPTQMSERFQQPVLSFIRDLKILNSALVLILLAYAYLARQSFADAVPFALILLATLIPSGLPATVNWIASQGITRLAQKGVLVPQGNTFTKAAEMQVLCLDRTGLLTENHLSVATLLPYSPYTEGDLLRLAALASDETARDPADLAILEKARLAGELPDFGQRVAFHPYNPLLKRWEAVYENDGQELRVMKGTPNVLFQLSGSDNGLYREAGRLASSGYRVLAVAVGDDTHLQIAGLVAFKDPLRADIIPLINWLYELGVNVIMTTRDELKAARAAVNEMGIIGKTYPMQMVHRQFHPADNDSATRESTIYAEALPEDKVKLVEIYQQAQCSIGITGDGINDLSALRQADIGIAVANATPAARSAADFILEEKGVSGIIDAILTSRQVSHQMMAYSLTILTMSLVIALFISLERVLAGTLVMTSNLLILLLLSSILLKISSSPTKTTAPRHPSRNSVQTLAWMVLSLAIPSLLLCYLVFWTGKILFHLPLPALQTLIFTFLVLNGQGIYYLLMEQGHAWEGLTSLNRLIGPLVVIMVVILVVSGGILVHPLPISLVFELIGFVLLYLLALDILKIRLFHWFEI